MNIKTAHKQMLAAATRYGMTDKIINPENTSGVSIFDPVLCELSYRWFCPPGGRILDPFAGGSVRGIVASVLGYNYFGVDLREEQIEANREQAIEICEDNQPTWICGDSKNIIDLSPGHYDLIFTCPPYADLEVYSDNPQDISTMPYPEFSKALGEIISRSASMLKENRFAVIVVGEVRDKNGFYYSFVPDVIQHFKDAGMEYYNEAILITQIGTLPIRAGNYFTTSRKFGKTHQNVLVFVKGDPKKATEDIGEVDFGVVEVEEPSE